MKGHLESEKMSWITFLIIFFTYTIVSMTKNTYSTAIATIVQEGLFTKADAGVINAGFYLLYSCAQLFGGALVDKAPFKMLLLGLFGSIVTNIAMAVSASYSVMLIAWSLNGLLQFGVWPAILKLATSVVMPEHRQKSMSYLFFAYPLGCIISYLLAAGLLKVGSWPGLFWSSAACLAFTTFLVIWLIAALRKKLVPDTEMPPIHEIQEAEPATVQENEPPQKTMSFGLILFSSGLIFLTVPALIRCMLDIGLKNWVPTMIMESYGVSPSFANLLTTVLLIVNLGGIFLVNWVYKRYKNVATAFGIFLLVSVPFLVLIVFTGKIHLAFILISLALTTTFMIAASQVINVIMPAAFTKQKKTGLITSFINSFGGLGVMIANYAYGLLADSFGWTVTAIIWLVLGIIATVFCFMAAPFWKRFTEKNA